MTGIRQPLAALRDRLGSTPSAVRVARSRPARVRMVAVLGSMAVVACGIGIAAAPAALAVADSVVVSSFDSGPIGVSGTVTFTPRAPAGYLNITVALPASEYTTAFSGGCAAAGITVAINGTTLPVACGTGTDGAYNTIVAYNYWSSPALTVTDVITMTWGASVVSRTGACSAAPFQISTSPLAPNTYTPVIPSLAGSTPAAPDAPATPVAPVAPAAPAAPPLPEPQSLPPVAGVAPVAEVPSGGSTGSVNGVPVTTTVTVNPAGGVQVAGGGATVALADLGPDGNPLPATGGGLAGTLGGGLSVSASGFLPQSQADVYMYSEQLWLGKATVDAGGNVVMSLTIPSWVTPGAHTLQFVGYQGPYTSIALSTGITVAAPAAASAAVQPVSGDATGYFRPGAVALTDAAKARLWNAVNAPAQGNAGAAVACSATHVKPETAGERALWAQRDTGVAGFLTRAGCDTVTARLGDLAGIAGAASMAIRITATAA